jgi:hypothetical protein
LLEASAELIFAGEGDIDELRRRIRGMKRRHFLRAAP